MEYLEKYNLSKNDINEIINKIDSMDRLEYELHEGNISKILDYLVERKFDIKNLLIYKSFMFYTPSDKLIEKLRLIKDEEIPMINEDIDLIEDYI